jgi:hypothetical protein
MNAAPAHWWHFIFFVFALCGVAAILLSDPVFSRLRNTALNPIQATAIIAVASGGVFGAAFWFLIIPYVPSVAKDISFTAMGSTAVYPEGTVIGGIRWSQRYSQLRVNIVNNTDDALDDVRIVIQADEPVVGITQVSQLPNVSFKVLGEPVVQEEILNPVTGRRRAIPLVLVASDAGYEAAIERLAPKAVLDIIMALANIDPETDKLPLGDVRSVLTVTIAGGKKYWYGLGSDQVFTVDRHPARTVQIDAAYNTARQRKTVAERINVFDMIDLIPRE